jgi:hypothetical protein
MAQDDYILFSDSEDGNKIKKAQYSNLKWEKGDQGIQWPQGIQGIQWPKGETWPQWPQGVQWEKGDTWATGATWARINSAAFSGNDIVFGETDGNTVTLSNAKTTLTWPQGEKGEQGEQWETGATGATWPQWPTWPAGNWISSITSSKAWKTTTVTITETNWTTDTFQIQDWADWEGAWDVVWPNSSTDWDIVLFDGATWKIIKDSGKSLNDMQEKLTAWTGIDITNNVISNTQTSAEWWNIWGILSNQTDLQDALDWKQDTLTAWTGISISSNTISNTWVTSVNGSTGAVSLSIPSNTSDLTNDSWFLTSSTWVTSFNWSTWAITYTAPVTSVNGSTWAVTVSAFSPSNAWTTDQVLTKTAGGYAWADASKWIENDTTGTTTTVTKIRAWTEAEYALITPDANTIYYVF